MDNNQEIPIPVKGQYALWQIIGIWLAGGAPMWILGWLVYPAMSVGLPPAEAALLRFKLLMVGLVWEFVLAMIILYYEEGNFRLGGETPLFIALAPFAPRFAFETWLLPKRHISSYSGSTNDDFKDLAVLLQDVLRRVDKALSFPLFNFIIHTSPFRDEANEYSHWHIEIMPKLTNVAGFEWGSGFYMNPTPPEEAAKFLRDIKP